MATPCLLRPIEPHLATYEEEWKRDHVAAMRCHELETILGMGIGIFNAIEYAFHVSRVAPDFTDEHDQLMKQVFGRWIHLCKQSEQAIERNAALFGTVKFAEEFRETARKARYILDNWTPPTSGSPEAIEKDFLRLAAKWKSERGHIASVNKMAQLPAYRAIVAMGRPAVPFLLRELEREPDHWFWALKEITGINPVPAEARGNVAAMANHWVRWGKGQGYRW